MKKTSLIFFPILLVILFVGWLINQDDVPIEQKNLENVLNNIEQIKTASYVSTFSAYNVYDTITPVYVEDCQIKEYVNPADTLVGASYIEFYMEDTTKMRYCYDGHMRARVHWEEKTMEIDSFKTNRLPHRPVWAPFFTRAKTILDYISETEDSILFAVQDLGNTLQFNLTIYNADTTVEFMGNRTIYEPVYKDFYEPDFSRYNIWINKSDYLPYKIKRDLPHSISIEETSNEVFNEDKISDFVASFYFPDYPLRKKIKVGDTSELLGKPAPNFILTDPVSNKKVSLNELKNKIILLEFTGIGCGPCYASVPFLKNLVNEYQNEDFQLVSIECWAKNETEIINYKKKNQLNYQFLKSDKIVEEQYQVSSVPQFILLDQNRTIMHTISGYSERSTGKDIQDQIDKLL